MPGQIQSIPPNPRQKEFFKALKRQPQSGGKPGHPGPPVDIWKVIKFFTSTLRYPLAFAEKT
jgi:hypothetical protein